MLVADCHCRCRTCPQCGPKYGWKTRQRMLEHADKFEHPAMFTLTVKPDHFAGDPVAALEEVTQEKLVSRLMKALKVARWIAVLEFQKNGFPHWHVLIDAPGGRIDLQKAWAFWGWTKSGWRIGGVDLRKTKFNNAQHAVHYITKYLIKTPKHGFPAWVLDFPKRIRFINASRSVGRVVSDREPTVRDVKQHPEKIEPEAEESLPVEHRSLRIRMANCGRRKKFFREYIDATTGETRLKLAGFLSADVWDRNGRRAARVLERDDKGREYIQDPGDFKDFADRVLEKAYKDLGLVVNWMPKAIDTQKGSHAARDGVSYLSETFI